jgi:hypothetical protein
MLALLVLAALVPIQFEELQPGVEYGKTRWIQDPKFGDGVVHVVRIDPKKAELKVGLASLDGVQKRTAAQWAEGKGFSVTTNAGMFDLDDHTAHVGYLRSGEHVNQPKWNEYKSAFAFSPGKAAVADLDSPEGKKTAMSHQTVMQNLRLISAARGNVWPANQRRWSEAALAGDDRGRVLIVFSRSPLTMKEFNEKLLALGLGVTRAMHLEGGPEASLSIRSAKVNLELCGSYETGFNENDDNKEQWPIPNVLGVAAPH